MAIVRIKFKDLYTTDNEQAWCDDGSEQQPEIFDFAVDGTWVNVSGNRTIENLTGNEPVLVLVCQAESARLKREGKTIVLEHEEPADEQTQGWIDVIRNTRQWKHAITITVE